MIEIRKTEIFAKWIDELQDIRTRARILVRIERLSAGNPGDVKPLGEGVSDRLWPRISGVLQKDWTKGGHPIGWRRQKESVKGHQSRLKSIS